MVVVFSQLKEEKFSPYTRGQWNYWKKLIQVFGCESQWILDEKKWIKNNHQIGVNLLANGSEFFFQKYLIL